MIKLSLFSGDFPLFLVNPLIQQSQVGATNDTGQEESHEMTSPSKQ
jgi:hypothetical protein